MSDPRPWAPPPLNPYKPLIVNVAVTGAVPTKADNPDLPCSPGEIAASVLACADAGASVFHLHVRDEAGAPVHRRDLYERTIAGIREVRTDLVLGVTTSSRVGAAFDDRTIGLDLSNDLRPDYASLTLGSFNFPRVVSHNPPDQIRRLLDHMIARGIRPEFEIFEPGMIDLLWRFLDEGLVEGVPVVNLLLGSFGATPAFVRDLVHLVDRLPPGTEWAAAGIGVFQRPMTIAAAVMGGNVRTGLEDAPRPPDDRPWTNADAVRLAAAAADVAGRSVATPDEVRVRYGLTTAGR